MQLLDILNIIKSHFNLLFKNKEFILPSEISSNHIYHTESGSGRGLVRITFVISENKQYCDYLLKTSSYTSHQRIDSSGVIKDLENYEGQFGWPILEDEKETKKEHSRIQSHNEKVHNLLLKKRLISK